MRRQIGVMRPRCMYMTKKYHCLHTLAYKCIQSTVIVLQPIERLSAHGDNRCQPTVVQASISQCRRNVHAMIRHIFSINSVTVHALDHILQTNDMMHRTTVFLTTRYDPGGQREFETRGECD